MILSEYELMRKFVVIIWLIILAFIPSHIFWYFEDKVYCWIDKTNVTIFLRNEEWTSKCKTYMDTIYQLALKKYNEISLIRWYIEQGADVYYRKSILEDKNAEFLQLVNYRTQIKSAIDKFETSFFDKYYAILKAPMELYYTDVETSYYVLINQNQSSRSANYSTRIAKIEQQMWNVSHVLNAKTLDEIMEVVPTYIYLKRQLAWE